MLVVVLLLVVLLVGMNTLVWGGAGLARALAALARRSRARSRSREHRFTRADLAVLVAAHYEEAVIAATLRAAVRQVPAGNVFVVSDASSDGTALIAMQEGATVLELDRNRGKAGALVAAIEHFALADRFRVVLFLDADTRLADDYVATGLPLFDDEDVVAVAGRATTLLQPRPATAVGRVLVAHRERVYVAMQYLVKYGQAAARANAVAIVPGFASMYRTDVLSRIEVDAPGLAIEDYNMTFEVHAKRLGRIAFSPAAAVAYTQDPDTLSDYVRQVHRWSLGFWQTRRRHGLHRGRFWAALAVTVLELLTSSAAILLLVPALAVSLVAAAVVALAPDASPVAVEVVRVLPPALLLAGALVPDYLLTILAAALGRRPGLLLPGILFPVVRVIDTVLLVRALAHAFSRTSTGVWRSPVRRPETASAPRDPGPPVPGAPGASAADRSVEDRDEVRA